MRRRVFDPKSPNGEPAVVVCPSCGVALDEKRPVELRTVRLPCRCHRGHVVHECRCRGCSATFLMEQHGSDGRLVVSQHHHTAAEAIRSIDRDAEVNAIERRFFRDDDR